MTRLGDYEITGLLARGGTSGVYRASHIATGEAVALKILDPLYADESEVADRLFGEHAISQRVQHPSLCDVRGARRSADGVPYLVMELIEGERLGACGPLALDAVIAIGAQIAGALAALHGAGIAHCDVKADNVIVMAGAARVKVIDYGVATRLDRPTPDDATIAGTPAAMAPEQWRGAPVAKSDVYGLGCLLYELITGEPPFTGALPQLMQAHCGRLPVRPRLLRGELPAELDALVMRALQKDPAMRPAMRELEAELASYGQSAGQRRNSRSESHSALPQRAQCAVQSGSLQLASPSPSSSAAA